MIEQSQRRGAFFALSILSVVVVLAAQMGLPVAPLRVVAGAFIAFFALGYALLLAARLPHLDGMTRAILSVPLSMAAVIIGGVALDLTPIGIHLGSLAVMLSLLMIVLLVAAAWRGGAAHAHSRGTPSWERGPLARPRHDAGPASLGRIAAIAGLLLALVAAGVWAGGGIIQASRDVPIYYTELYLQRVTRAVPKGGSHLEAVVTFAVHNRERRNMTYAVRTLVRQPGRGTATLVAQGVLTVRRGAIAAQAVRVHYECGDEIQVQLFQRGTLPATRWYPLRGGADPAYRRLQLRPRCACPHGRGCTRSARGPHGNTAGQL